MHTSTSTSRFTWLHGAVIGVGALVFVLLFFADKTNLNNDRGAVAATMGQEQDTQTAPKGGLLDLIQPLNGLEGWDEIRIALAKAKDKPEEADQLRETVIFLRDRGRLDAAAVYAGRLADLEPNVKNWLVAGALAREAAQSTPDIASNQETFGKFVDQSIRYLDQAVGQEPENEDVLIELGLAYIGSGKGEFSMQGIQQLLKVLELNPENAEAAFHLGMFSRQTGQWEKAESRFQTVVRVDPQNYTAKYYLGLTYLDQGKAEMAKSLLLEVSKDSPEPELQQLAKEVLEKI